MSREDVLWRALADPMRREILSLLRTEPMTTGQLSACFPVTRFAVMKHLNLLAGAGLVVERRRGRERWNHLNVAPLRELLSRWVLAREAGWLEGLDHLRAISSREEEEMKSNAATDVLFIEIEVAIAAPIHRVWEAAIEEVENWWPGDFRINGPDSRMELEPRAGGRLVERNGEAELLWGQVIRIEPARMLQLAGHLAPEFGGPATSIWSITLEAEGEGTKLKLSDSVVGHVDEKMRSSLESGWKHLFESGLRDYIERKPGS